MSMTMTNLINFSFFSTYLNKEQAHLTNYESKKKQKTTKYEFILSYRVDRFLTQCVNYEIC